MQLARPGEVGGGAGLQIHAAERERDELEQIGLVVDDQHDRLGRSGALLAGGRVRSSAFPATRIGEHQPEHAAAARAWFVQQRRAVALRQLARQKQAEPAAAAAAIERLKDALRVLQCDAGATIGDFQKGARRTAHAAAAQLDRQGFVASDGMLNGVLAQVPDDLPQLIGVDAHLDVRVCGLVTSSRVRGHCMVSQNSS